MFGREFRRSASFFLIFASFLVAGACRSNRNETPAGLIVVNAPVTGKVRRVLVAEGTEVREKASLIEISVAADVPAPSENANRQTVATPDIQAEIKAAEEQLERASVEQQRIEPLVTANSAPQSHLDAARAEYQRAQERLDQLRRREQTAPPSMPGGGQENSVVFDSAPRETVVQVAAPASGSVRVISVRPGQSVKAGDPVATISAD